MRILPRLLVFLGLLGLILFLLGEVRRYMAGNHEDQTPVFVLFAAILVTGAVAGGLFAKTILPMIGDRFGAMIYGSNEVDDSDPVIQAHQCLEEKDYPGALKFFRRALATNPDDTALIGEIVDLQCRHLDEAESAAALLKMTLEKHWPPDEMSFLHCKLAEVLGWHLDNPFEARQILEQAIAEAPQSLYAHTASDLLRKLGEG